MTPLVNTVPDAWQFFLDNWLILLLMPAVGGFIGWSTKLLAIWMLFYPLEYKGVGPIGWQGMLPRRAAKFGSHAAEIVLGSVVDPRELIDRLDPRAMVAEVDDLMASALDDVARDLVGDAWNQAPASAKALVLARMRSRAPVVAANLMEQAKDNLDEMFDLTYIVTQTLIKDKVLLNDFLSGPLEPAWRFMKNFGLLFGVVVGCLQIVAFSFTENHLVLPIAGLIVGFASDWIALKMLLGPLEPKRYFGVFRWHGMFYQMRGTLMPDLAKFAGSQIITPRVILDAVLASALVDRLFAMIHSEVGVAIDAELGSLKPLVPAVIGSQRYYALRDVVVAQARRRLPEAADRIEPYAKEAMEVEKTITTTFEDMTNEQLLSMLRPIFKDDEWIIVVLGGVLGFAVAELQVYLLTVLGGI